jgi:nuclear transport factor 2 (NTF2) superfamily protein
MHAKSPFPPFTEQSVIQKIRMAEDAWNSCEFVNGRQQVRDFLTRMGKRTRLSFDKRTLGLKRQSYCRKICL